MIKGLDGDHGADFSQATVSPFCTLVKPEPADDKSIGSDGEGDDVTEMPAENCEVNGVAQDGEQVADKADNEEAIEEAKH